MPGPPAMKQCSPAIGLKCSREAIVWQAALPGAPNRKSSGPLRDRYCLVVALYGAAVCLEASLTAAYRLIDPAPALPTPLPLSSGPWLMRVAVGFCASSWLATGLPFGVIAFASQS